MAKIIFFFLILFIMLFPVFMSTKTYKSVKHKNNNTLPLIEVANGTFKKYNFVLEINGTFKKLNIFKNYYEFNNLYANDIVKQEKYFAKWALKNNNVIKAKNATYKNSDYILHSKNVIYYEVKKALSGNDFNFTSGKAKGKGKYFKIDRNKNIYAKNIIYYIKVKK